MTSLERSQLRDSASPVHPSERTGLRKPLGRALALDVNICEDWILTAANLPRMAKRRETRFHAGGLPPR
jgi:hypothetical protein